MTYDARVPMDKSAFDHPETRQAWHRARRRVRAGLVALLLATVGVLWLIGAFPDWFDTRRSTLAPALFFGLFLPTALFSYISTLRRLRRMRTVLESHPWQHRESARKCLRARESQGVAVELMNEDGSWSPAMAARNPLRWYRWVKSMEHGLWLAGRPSQGAVIALPGGRGLMTLEPGYDARLAQRRPDRNTARPGARR